MITEAIFNIMFAFPIVILNLIPSLPVVSLPASFAGLLEIFVIGNTFFPLGDLLLYLSVWLALSVFSLTKQFIEWLYKLVPFV